MKAEQRRDVFVIQLKSATPEWWGVFVGMQLRRHYASKREAEAAAAELGEDLDIAAWVAAAPGWMPARRAVGLL